ncbi:Adenylyl cyclase-associated protein [Strongyloides ratti]|uniref:Adenylyl cyclase-associated protein n=1 Tax=Strongyloides ratti TaxID=34506 RepID=A0A090L103_STRRB|nr:Adenylyl cyclase-associated protein [Strongyloides ratti]CEF61777.1 Adenylyl cyclase-associated protein [Strongyloides ratti]
MNEIMSESQLEGLIKRLESAVVKVETLAMQKPCLPPKPPSGSCGNKSSTDDKAPPNVVKQFEDDVITVVNDFIDLCNKIGGDLVNAGERIKNIFEDQKNFIWLAASQQQISDSELSLKLAPICKLMEDMVEFKDANRRSNFFNHLSAIAEGIQSTGWLTVKKTPAPFVKDMQEASMFYINRVRKDHKDGDKIHLDWANQWVAVLDSLYKYVKQNHTTGLVWNSSPGNAPSDSVSSSKTGKSLSGGPPPPPPPPPKDLFNDVKKVTPSDGREALFAELNKGEAITSGLKKVTADMQTHKNPSLRISSVVSDTNKNKTSSSQNVPKVETVKPPRLELEQGKNWCVEYYKNDKNVVVNINDMKQTVYVFKCEGSVIQIKGKVNSIILDSCKKTSIVFENLLSQIEVINCQSIQVQTMGKLPTISIQKTDGCQVYLSKESFDAEIVHSKSSEMNVLIPNGEDGEFIEFALPEQYKTTYDAVKNKIDTVLSDI